MILVHIVGAFSIVKKVSIRRIEETNQRTGLPKLYVATNRLLNYIASTVLLSSLNKHCTMMS